MNKNLHFKEFNTLKKFVVILSDKIKNKFNQSLLQAHVDHLKKIKQAGKLILCGPFTDDFSAFQLLCAINLDEATKMIKQDPFISAGYYSSFEIKELIEANENNSWLMEHPQTKEKGV